MLFAAGNPVQLSELARVLNWPEAHVDQIAQALKEKLARDESGLTLRQTGGGWQLVTLPQVYPVVERLAEVTDRHIAAPTMETLSIIAFKQPITKQEIEQIRGVRVDRAMQKLLELELIEEQGRKPVIGRPILYGTTELFLRSFGLNSLAELPTLPTNAEAAAGLDEAQLRLLDESGLLDAENQEQELDFGEPLEGPLDQDTGDND